LRIHKPRLPVFQIKVEKSCFLLQFFVSWRFLFVVQILIFPPFFVNFIILHFAQFRNFGNFFLVLHKSKSYLFYSIPNVAQFHKLSEFQLARECSTMLFFSPNFVNLNYSVKRNLYWSLLYLGFSFE
jgi:hypothetical protein